MIDNQTKKARVGIIFALPVEEASLTNVLSDSYVPLHVKNGYTTWYIKDVELIVCVCGIGVIRAARAAQKLIEHGAQVLLSAGFATALDCNSSVGDVIVANRIMSEYSPYSEPVLASPGVIASMPPSGAFGFSIKLGDMVTSRRIICRSEEKQEIGQRTGAAALDMEAYSIGNVCRFADIPFAAIKSISDAADENLPEVFKNLAMLQNNTSRALFVFSMPQLWRPALRLKRNADKASKNLADVLSMMLVRLV